MKTKLKLALASTFLLCSYINQSGATAGTATVLVEIGNSPESSEWQIHAGVPGKGITMATSRESAFYNEPSFIITHVQGGGESRVSLKPDRAYYDGNGTVFMVANENSNKRVPLVMTVNTSDIWLWDEGAGEFALKSSLPIGKTVEFKLTNSGTSMPAGKYNIKMDLITTGV